MIKQKREQILKQADQVIEKWRPLLFLNDWAFTKTYCKTADDEFDSMAETSIDWRYKYCTITLYPRFFEKTKSEREFAIVHELCHCITNQMDDLCFRLLRGSLVTNEERKNTREVVTQWIANAIYTMEASK